MSSSVHVDLASLVFRGLGALVAPELLRAQQSLMLVTFGWSNYVLSYRKMVQLLSVERVPLLGLVALVLRTVPHPLLGSQ